MLQHEHAIRKHAYKVMATAGYTFGAALVHAYKEPSVKERNFTTPLALHAKRPQPWNATERPTKRKSAKGKGKSKDGKGAAPLRMTLPRPPALRTDRAKPHRCRRYSLLTYQHGYLACQVDPEEETPGDPASQTVYVNLVGTFGLLR